MTNNTDSYTFDEVCQEKLVHGFASGVLVNETKTYYTIARDWFEEHDTFRGIATYPKSGLVKVKKYDLLKKVREND